MNTITKLIAAAAVALLPFQSSAALLIYRIIDSQTCALQFVYYGPGVEPKPFIGVDSTVEDDNGNTYTVVAIDPGAFNNPDHYYSLTKVDLPNTIREIGDSAFLSCKALKEINLSSLTSLKRIGKYAFLNCISLTHVNLPNNLEEIDDYAFNGCIDLQTIHMGNSTWKLGTCVLGFSHPKLNMITGQFAVNNEFLVYYGELQAWAGAGRTVCNIPDGVHTIGEHALSYLEYNTEVSIPNSVVDIYPNAFSSAGITSIQLPDNIDYIGNRAFEYCSNLTTINIPTKLRTLGHKVFDECTSLNCNLVFPATITKLPQYTFNNCTKLQTVTLPSTMTEIGPRCFEGCTALTKVALPESLEKIGNYCFKNSGFEFGSWVSSFPSSLKSIGSEAFAGTNVESARFSEGFTTIGESAFADCPQLYLINLPSTIAEIGKDAFKGCDDLERVYCHKSTPPVLNNSTSPFAGLSLNNVELYVPQRKKSAYQGATVWMDFGTIYDTLTPAEEPGDVNGDGTVDIADVNCCINIILGSEPASKYEGRADVNDDGTVDIADVNSAINIILGK